jgi:hypothetical protein
VLCIIIESIEVILYYVIIPIEKAESPGKQNFRELLISTSYQLQVRKQDHHWARQRHESAASRCRALDTGRAE